MRDHGAFRLCLLFRCRARLFLNDCVKKRQKIRLHEADTERDSSLRVSISVNVLKRDRSKEENP